MAQAEKQNWDLEADVVIIGSGAAGLPAAIKAVDGGATVIIVEAITMSAATRLLAAAIWSPSGTSAQKKRNPRSPDTVFSDLTDWSIVQGNGTPDFRTTIAR
jgi:succinate dehydrogenase/fumarate reductase flavoprotein subunit